MRYLKITIAYDGTDYHGCRRSPATHHSGRNHQRAAAPNSRNISMHAAGRTDAGVHALGQIASFRHALGFVLRRKFQRALNAILPPTFEIVSAEETGPDFSARWSARSKLYRYRLYRGKVVPPRCGVLCALSVPLDEDKMRDARRGWWVATISHHLRLRPAPKRTTRNARRFANLFDGVGALGR